MAALRRVIATIGIVATSAVEALRAGWLAIGIFLLLAAAALWGWLAIGIFLVLGAAALWVMWWLWWLLPQRYVAGLALKIRDPKARADTEDNFRKTVGQALGGVAVLIGAAFAYLQFTQQQRAAHDLLISNQVSKGFEQLAGRETAMRLGGIYALEGVMNASPEYHQPVLEALCAFVRDGTATNWTVGNPATDIQAALTVIGRRSDGLGRVDLAGARLHLAALRGGALRGAVLRSANLSEADLNKADLSGADLNGANLDGAVLNGANLSSAVLIAAQLSGADLNGANLDGAVLNGANLSSADLSSADLIAAQLSGANLNGVNLNGANLNSTWDLTQTQLDQACGTDAKLPPGMTLKPCPK